MQAATSSLFFPFPRIPSTRANSTGATSRKSPSGEAPPCDFRSLQPKTRLTKLVWYQMGGEVSERQWNDLLGIIKVKGQELDPDYLQRWAAHLGVALLLERLWETEQSWGS